ncbi:MAG: Gfo/Idh/MocA family oxidoreductase [Planctomycetes bacterium]|nr:Gfo/Idh/MocA family oxidoreductase [Planctomycetota bacterium]
MSATPKAPAVAVVGCGYWGKNLVRNFAELGALSIVSEPGEAGQRKAREIAPGAKIVADYDAVLASDVRGVVLATPAATHHALARRALEAGKDVFVEKPLALRHEDAAQLVEIAAASGRMLMVGHVLEYHPAIRAIDGLVREGELGKVQYVYSNRLNLGKVRTEENILWSFAPHDVAIILRLVGAMPIQVSACGGNYITANIADVSVSNLLFDDGTRAHVFVSWLHPFKEQRLVVVGDRRMATYDDIAKKLVVYEKRVDRSVDGPVPFQGEGHEIAFSAEEPLRLECQAFLDAIATRRPPLTDGVSGLATLKVLQAAQRSLMTGGEPVPLHRL